MELICILLGIGLILIVYLITRNTKVALFRVEILNLCDNYFYKHIAEDNIEKTWDTLYNKYTYEQMLFSFKPLKLKAWYTIEELKNYDC